MKSSISVYKGVNEGGLSTQEYAKNVAMGAAQLMQYAGLKSVSVGISTDAMSSTARLQGYEEMEFAPDSVKRLAPFFAEGLAKVFSAAGIVSISLDTSSASDRSSLHGMWGSSGMKDLKKAPERKSMLEPPDLSDGVKDVAKGLDWSEIRVD